jgi:hypothetical protein
VAFVRKRISRRMGKSSTGPMRTGIPISRGRRDEDQDEIAAVSPPLQRLYPRLCGRKGRRKIEGFYVRVSRAASATAWGRRAGKSFFRPRIFNSKEHF